MVNGKKLIAMILIFTMTFSNFAFVTESIAATSFVSIFGASSNTGNENVEFEAFLSNEENKASSMVSEVNNENLAIDLMLDVKDSGYLKNAKVEINAKDEGELNFAIKEDNKVAENTMVQSLKDNVLELNKIDNSTEKLEISIPIEYEMEEYINESKLNSTTKVVLSGVYVDDNGKENEISKEIELMLAWKDERTVRIENEVSKYIQFSDDGIILQTVVKVDSSNPDKNSLPVKETEVNIDVPTISNVKPSEVTVVANSTAGTNGKGVGNVEFGTDNWTYNELENKLKIKVENTKQLVEVNKNNGFLKTEEETVKEDRYYSVAGIDEYVVTYVFKGVKALDEMNLEYKISADVTKFSGIDSEKNITVTTADAAQKYILTGQTGNLVSYNIENETKEVSKVYGYLDNKEVTFDTKTAINISYKEMVEEIVVEDTANYYIDKSGNKVEADDMYYKEISVNKDNFNEILGEEGSIQIIDEAGNILATINKDYEADENGNYKVMFQDRISKVSIKTTKPINEGNLIISNKKAVLNTSVDKNTYANIEYIATDTIQKAKFNYVSDLAELGNCTVKTKLNDTKTDINLVVDRESLSTVTPNSNVEMRLELNNDEETSDVFGNSVFEIEMPEYVTGMTVTNASMIYGEGLNISNVEAYSRDGKPVIKVTVDGKQNDLNSGALTNGTNIVLNADISVDKYAPSIDTEFKAFCYNSEATNYDNAVSYSINESTVCDYEEAKIVYSAPNGVVAINTIANYNDVGTTVTSIKQGEVTDYIDIYSEAKNATMEVVVVNNNENSVSNLSILGRIPFKGVKDLTTGEDLGTTIDTKMVRGIVSDASNNGEFTVYYSEKEDADKDLANSSNGWVTNPESLENVKSYLIVPNDNNYKMEAKQVLKFNYEYQIPENLDHNEKIYGTFLAYYTNNSETAVLDETAKPDQVGLTTGVGPEIELEATTSAKTIKETDEFEATIVVTNVGEDIANDVTVNIPVPTDTTYISSKMNRETATAGLVENVVVVKLPTLSKESTLEITVKFKVNETLTTDANSLKVEAVATAKDLNTELRAETEAIEFVKAKLAVDQILNFDYDGNTIFSKGTKIPDFITVYNRTDEEQKNVVVEIELNGIKYISNDSENENITFDESSNKITWKIDSLEGYGYRSCTLDLEVGDLSEGVTKGVVDIKSTIKADNTETYNGTEINLLSGKSSLTITQTSSTPTYVNECDEIDYVFTITNEGAKGSNNILLTDLVPDGLVITDMKYVIDGEEYSSSLYETKNAELTLEIPAETTVDVNVKAYANSLDGVQEKTVTNEATLVGEDAVEVKSNTVTHIIQSVSNIDTTEEASTNYNTTSETNVTNNSISGDITKTYKVTGTAWLDSNKNGMRDEGESRMSNVTAMLVDSSSGDIKATVTTDNNGEYGFTGIQNGSYLVVFKYDTVSYTTTTYRKESVESNINSDAVVTKIEQDGRKEYAGVTDVITVNSSNVTNIDIGLVETDKFSLELDKAITKVTVQNSQGTVTEEFDKSKLAKYDIAAKYLAGTTVYVEYTMTVTNNGDLSGFASEIVDYLPKGMTFNSNLNGEWYTGTDGNLYTKSLSDIELAPGESRTITLVLTKQMTADNTGLVSNTAEIADDYNIYGVSDKNSKPFNKAQGEDDMSTADTILTVKTGESLIYVSAIIVSAICGCAVAFIVYEKFLKNKRKGGV